MSQTINDDLLVTGSLTIDGVLEVSGLQVANLHVDGPLDTSITGNAGTATLAANATSAETAKKVTGIINPISASGASTTTFLRGDGTWAAPSTEGFVSGTITSIDNELVLFSGASGTALKRGSGTGFVKVTGGVVSTVNETYYKTSDTVVNAVNATTATKLTTARTIGGVSFDGTININLPGVNTVGNQDTTGNAATATNTSQLNGQPASFYQNAGNLNSGTLPDAQFPAILPAVSGQNLTNLNANNLTAGTLPMARLSGTLPALNGSALTSLNASNLSSGAIPAARMGSAITHTSYSGSNTLSAMAVGEVRICSCTSATQYTVTMPAGGTYYVVAPHGSSFVLSGGGSINTPSLIVKRVA